KCRRGRNPGHRRRHCGMGGYIEDRWLLHRGPLRGSSFLFGLLQRFVNSAHSFLSLGRSCSDWRKRSAKVAKVFNASSRSNLSLVEFAGSIFAVPAPLPLTLPWAPSFVRSKSRATASTTAVDTRRCWSTKALTRACSHSRLTTRG